MTQGISDMLGLPTLHEVIKKNEQEQSTEDDSELKASRATSVLQDLSRKLALLEGTDHGEAMDELHTEIMQHARDLMAYGFNTDMRSMARIFEVAGQFYNHAITTKNSKREMQLKSLKLALDKKKLELDEKKVNHVIGTNQVASIDGGSVLVEDRNDLIKRLSEEIKNQK